jgi:hypothetical protein
MGIKAAKSLHINDFHQMPATCSAAWSDADFRRRIVM